MALEILVETVEAQRRAGADGQIGIARHVPGPEAVDAARQHAKRCFGAGRLLHAVDDPAPAAAPEDQRIGALEDLHPLDVVEVAVVLHIVAHPIEEEVGGGVLSAQGDLVAVSLALADGGAGYIAQHVGDRSVGLILELFARHHGDALGHVEQRGIGLGGGDGIDRAVTLGLADHEYGLLILYGRVLRMSSEGYGQYGRRQQICRDVHETLPSLTAGLKLVASALQ